MEVQKDYDVVDQKDQLSPGTDILFGISCYDTASYDGKVFVYHDVKYCWIISRLRSFVSGNIRYTTGKKRIITQLKEKKVPERER